MLSQEMTKMRILPTSKLIGCAETYHKGGIAFANVV